MIAHDMTDVLLSESVSQLKLKPENMTLYICSDKFDESAQEEDYPADARPYLCLLLLLEVTPVLSCRVL